MLKNLFIASSLFLMLSCNINKKPEFVKVMTINVVDYNSQNITLTSDMVFKNPNLLGGVLQANQVKVFVNEIDMGTINTPDFKVPAKEEFTVPIVFKFPFKRLFNDGENVIVNIFNTLKDRNIDVQLKGVITYKLDAFSYDYPLDYSEKISLKKN